MKVIITGHSRGLGKHLHSFFYGQLNTEVIGYSHSTHGDLSSKAVREELIQLAHDADVFINNARSGFSQVDLLFELYQSWSHRQDSPLILNIGSQAVHDHMLRKVNDTYFYSKIALRELSLRLSQSEKVRIVSLNPGLLSTERVNQSPALNGKKKVDIEQFLMVVDWLVHCPKSLLIYDMSLRAF